MFDTLFGAEMPLAARFFLAFLIVLGLIGVTAWAVRRFGTGRLGGPSARGRQPRLGVIDYATVDARRRLILVRRDNVEHLLIIGGPTDVVVESNIVRAVAAPRDVTLPRPSAAEALPRGVPTQEAGSGSWPLQPEPSSAPATRQPPRVEPAPEDRPPWSLQPTADTPKRPQRDTLASLAEELQMRPAGQRNRPPGSPRGQESPIEPHVESHVEPHAEPHVEPQPEPADEAEAEPALETRAEPRAEPRIAAEHPDPAEAATADQSLAEMAHRLEAVLRKPISQPEPRQPRMPIMPPRATPPVEPAATPQRAMPQEHAAVPPRATPPEHAAPPPRGPLSGERPATPAAAQRPTVRPADPKAARPDGKPTPPARPEAKPAPAQGKTLYDSLEQEMASLLGRPTNKT